MTIFFSQVSQVLHDGRAPANATVGLAFEDMDAPMQAPMGTDMGTPMMAPITTPMVTPMMTPINKPVDTPGWHVERSWQAVPTRPPSRRISLV